MARKMAAEARAASLASTVLKVFKQSGIVGGLVLQPTAEMLIAGAAKYDEITGSTGQIGSTTAVRRIYDAMVSST